MIWKKINCLNVYSVDPLLLILVKSHFPSMFKPALLHNTYDIDLLTIYQHQKQILGGQVMRDNKETTQILYKRRNLRESLQKTTPGATLTMQTCSEICFIHSSICSVYLTNMLLQHSRIFSINDVLLFIKKIINKFNQLR